MSDLLMYECGDGGELGISGGDLQLDNTFYSAMYLSLFEGRNFYNQLEDGFDESDTYDFETLLNSVSTEKDLKQIESVANLKLGWMIRDGLVAGVDTKAVFTANQIVSIDITTSQPDGSSEKYSLIWDQEKKLLSRFGEIYGRI